MPLIPLFLPQGGSKPILSFVDSTGMNQLPPGIIVTLTSGGMLVGTFMLQADGIVPFVLGAGTYTATFTGTQAPTGSVTFTATGVGPSIITVPNYMSPTYSGDGYAAEAAYHLVLGWHNVS
jgi:hypothetical protein